MDIKAMWAEKLSPDGKKPKKNEEEDMQIECVTWFDTRFPRLKDFLHHSPNGGVRTLKEGARFKKMGTRKGFPDLIWWMPYFDYDTNKVIPSHFIELKTDKGKQSPEQKEFEKQAHAVGVGYTVVRTKLEFMKVMYKILYNHMMLVQNHSVLHPDDFLALNLFPQEMKQIASIANEIKSTEQHEAFLKDCREKAKAIRKTQRVYKRKTPEVRE